MLYYIDKSIESPSDTVTNLVIDSFKTAVVPLGYL